MAMVYITQIYNIKWVGSDGKRGREELGGAERGNP